MDTQTTTNPTADQLIAALTAAGLDARIGTADWTTVVEVTFPVDSELARAAGVPRDAARAFLWTMTYDGHGDLFLSDETAGWGIFYTEPGRDEDHYAPEYADAFTVWPNLPDEARILDADTFTRWHTDAVRDLLAVQGPLTYRRTTQTIADTAAPLVTAPPPEPRTITFTVAATVTVDADAYELTYHEDATDNAMAYVTGTLTGGIFPDDSGVKVTRATVTGARANY